jgi:hypothetical protein
MAWVKRNLYFLIGSLVAVVLMGLGGYLLYSQMSDESKISSDIEGLYAELNDYNNQKPHPGSEGEGKVDNVKAAREQQAALVAYINKTHTFFDRIPSIPDTSNGKVTDAEFARNLQNTVVQLQREAGEKSVVLPHDYYFTFEAQKPLLIFDPASRDRLAVSLGEVKAICDVLFDAKVNSLVWLRRELISANDTNAPDYLPSDEKTVSTPMADLTPYRIRFECFSGELGSVLAGFAASPHGFVVKTINVNPSSGAGPDEAMNEFSGRFRNLPPGAFFSKEGNAIVLPPPPVNGVRQFTPPPATTGPGTPAARPTVPTTFLNEKPLQVTLLVQVVKLKAGK